MLHRENACRKLADLAVLLQDIFMVMPHQLTRTVIGSDLVEGKIVYDGKVLMVHETSKSFGSSCPAFPK